MELIEKRVNEKIEQLLSERTLNQILWDSNCMGCMGPAWYNEEDYMDKTVEYMEQYSEYHMEYCYDNIGDMDEEDSGDMFTAFSTLLVKIVEDVIYDIEIEQFETNSGQYWEQLEEINGLVVKESVVWEDGFTVVNGIHIFTYEDDDTTNDIDMFLEWDINTDWSFGGRYNGDYIEFDDFQSLIQFIKENIKK